MPSEKEIIAGKISDLCESPICKTDDPLFEQIRFALKIVELIQARCLFTVEHISDCNTCSFISAIWNDAKNDQK